MKTKHYLAGLFGCAVMAAAPAAFGTSFEPTTFGDNVAAAQLSVIGEVENIRYERRNGSIVTITQYSVQFPGFGRAPAMIEVVTPGGRMQSGRFPVAEVVADSPRTLMGQKSLLLLQRGDRFGEFRPVGLSQGVIPVATGRDGVERVMLPPSVGGPAGIRDSLRTVRQLRRSVRLDGADIRIDR